MPRSAPTRCTVCRRELATRRGRCDEHQRKAWENTSKRNQLIDKGRWLVVQADHLRIEPTCRFCGADHDLTVDHIWEIADGGALYDHDNLQTLCAPCHDGKTEAAADYRRRHR